MIKDTKYGGWFSDNGYEIREVDKSEDRGKIIKDLGSGYVFNLWTDAKKNIDWLTGESGSKAVSTYSDIQNFQTFYRKKVKEDKIDD